MKRIIALCLAAVMTAICAACGQQAAAEPANMGPQVSQMKAICELAVMECYYHKVAKYFVEDAS